MSFLNKSVNYSQTTVLKENVLLPLLKSYNNFVLKKSGEFSIDKDVNTGISYDYIIPNNNKKYYLLITKKQLLEQQKSNQKYDILHFFPDQYNKDDDLLEKNRSSDFYLEIDSFFDDELLQKFYIRVRPGGWWSKFSKGEEDGYFKNMMLTWFFALISTYSLLFVMGYLIFAEWQQMGIWLFVGSIGSFFFLRFVKKIL